MIRPPEDTTIGQRVVTTFIIVLTIILILALIGWLSGGWDETPAATADDPPIDPKHEEHILALDREALDKAYKDHIGLVFGVWMKAPSDPQSPKRAGTGARNAREGYAISVNKIEQREQRLKDLKK
jgi:hypothetical protein